jgi:hypothetical protein
MAPKRKLPVDGRGETVPFNHQQPWRNASNLDTNADQFAQVAERTPKVLGHLESSIVVNVVKIVLRSFSALLFRYPERGCGVLRTVRNKYYNRTKKRL